MDEPVCPPGDQVKVPPGVGLVAVRVVLWPLQMVGLLTLTVAAEPIVTVIWSWLLQPLAVAVSVYVVVVVGVATGFNIFGLLSVADGDQLTVGLIFPAHPVTPTLAVCPPVIMVIPPIKEVVPHSIL